MSGIRHESKVRIRSRALLARRGERPQAIWFLEDGWAARYRVLRDGRRHISHFYMPGDLCDLSWLVADQADQTVIALTPIKATGVDRETLGASLAANARLSCQVASDALGSIRTQAEWLVTLGCKSAIEKVGQLFCEVYARLERSGKAASHQCHFPLSQQDIADFTGMTSVHVCRTLRKLRQERLIELQRQQLRILDFDRLAKLCAFDGRYLRSEGEANGLQAAAA